NKAMMRPLLVAGVEKRLVLFNALISFPLIAATHFHVPACFLGVAFFVVVHVLLRLVSKRDPYIGLIFKRSTRYSLRAYFPAKSHPLMLTTWAVSTISKSR